MKSIFSLLLDVSVKDGLYWANVAVDVIFGVVSALITAVITSWLLDRAFRKSRDLGESLKKVGIEKIDYSSGTMKRKDRNILFGERGNPKPNELKICFITGDNFCKDNFENLINLVKNGRTIKALIGNPKDCDRSEEYFKRFSEKKFEDLHCTDEDKDKLATLYVKYNELHGDELRKLCYLERTYLMVSKDIIERKSKLKYLRPYKNLNLEEKKQIWVERISSTGDHVMQAVLVTRMFDLINAESENGGKADLRYYHDEYRIPIILAEFYCDCKSNENKLMLWSNINAPVRETTKSINVFGVDKCEEDPTYVNDINYTFEYLFEKYPSQKTV